MVLQVKVYLVDPGDLRQTMNIPIVFLVLLSTAHVRVLGQLFSIHDVTVRTLVRSSAYQALSRHTLAELGAYLASDGLAKLKTPNSATRFELPSSEKSMLSDLSISVFGGPHPSLGMLCCESFEANEKKSGPCLRDPVATPQVKQMEVGHRFFGLAHIGEAERDAAECFRPEAGSETLDFCCARDIIPLFGGCDGFDDCSMQLGNPQG
jgi:hypothetical protein